MLPTPEVQADGPSGSSASDHSSHGGGDRLVASIHDLCARLSVFEAAAPNNTSSSGPLASSNASRDSGAGPEDQSSPLSIAAPPVARPRELKHLLSEASALLGRLGAGWVGTAAHPAAARAAAAAGPPVIIPNALITTHVASALFIILDTLASAARAAWGLLFVYNDATRRLVVVCGCGERYARPGSLAIAAPSQHAAPSVSQAAESLRPGGGGAATGSLEAHVIDTGIAVNMATAATEPAATGDLDDAFLVRDAAALASQADGQSADTAIELAMRIGQATRTRNALLVPVFKPGSHNTEVIGLVELGNKAPEPGNPQAAPIFSEDDEARVVEAAAMIANIMSKFPMDLAGRYNHHHGIDGRLAAMLAGRQPPPHHVQAEAPRGVQAASQPHDYFRAAVLRTSTLRTQQLIYRTQEARSAAAIRKTDLRAHAAPLDPGAAARSNAKFDGRTLPAPTAVSPAAPPKSAAAAPPPGYLPQLPADATVVDVLEQSLRVGESWRAAVMLNIELETEIRRLHEALRVSRREVARLQDVVQSLRLAHTNA